MPRVEQLRTGDPRPLREKDLARLRRHGRPRAHPGFCGGGVGPVATAHPRRRADAGRLRRGGSVGGPGADLFSGPLPIAANDNWGDAVSAADLAAAARQTGGFVLPGNRRDAVLLVALRAGNYTASVAGVGGATGTALVEIYVVP